MADSTPSLVVVCTANLSRSPMAAALLAVALGPAARVSSAGVAATPGRSPAPDAVRAMAERGLDIVDHRSRPLDPATMATTDLVLTMTRAHARDVAVTHIGSFGRTFTLKELVRRAGPVGPRASDRSVADWLGEIGRGRRVADLVGDDPADDVADPYRHPFAAYERTATELAAAIDAFTGLAFPRP